MTNYPLFRDGELRVYLDDLRVRALARVAAVTAQALRAGPESVSIDIVDAFKLVRIEYDFTKITRSEPIEVTVTGQQSGDLYSVPGLAFDFFLPVTGSTDLLRLKASTFGLGATPEASVARDTLTFRVSGNNLTAADINMRVASFQSTIEEMTGWTNTDLLAWNAQLQPSVLAAVLGRKQRLDSAASISDDLGIPPK